MLDGHRMMSTRTPLESAHARGIAARTPRTPRATRIVRCWIGLVFCALTMACGASSSKAKSVGNEASPKPNEAFLHAERATSADAEGKEPQDGEPTQDAGDNDAEVQGVDAFGIPSGVLRAQAWPETEKEGGWRALEQRQGSFITTENSGGRTFVFSSLTDSMPAKGIFIEFPADLKPEEVPTLISVSLSPTPIRVTRDAWPAIEPLLRSAGIAQIHVQPGSKVYLEFDGVERVSLLNLRFWTEAQRGRIGLGRVRLVYQRAQVDGTAYQRIALTPLQDAETLPQDAGVLGTDGSITLPHRKRSK